MVIASCVVGTLTPHLATCSTCTLIAAPSVEVLKTAFTPIGISGAQRQWLGSARQYGGSRGRGPMVTGWKNNMNAQETQRLVEIHRQAAIRANPHLVNVQPEPQREKVYVPVFVETQPQGKNWDVFGHRWY